MQPVYQKTSDFFAPRPQVSDKSKSTKPAEHLWKMTYQKKFKKLGSEIFPSGFVAKMKRSFNNFVQSELEKKKQIDKLAIGTYLGAEYLSGYVGAAPRIRGYYAYHHTCDLLESTTTQNQLVRELHDAELYLSAINNGKTQDTSKKIHEKLHKLKIGKSMVLPAYSKKHAMLLRITCTEDLDGKKKYKCVLYNEGDGIQSYHYRKIDENGKQLFQTALEITDIPEENLSFNFFKNLFDCRVKQETTSEDVYKTLKNLGGKIAHPSDDARLWSPGQLAGSCSTSCILSLIRAQSSPAEYKKFKQKAV